MDLACRLTTDAQTDIWA